MIGFIGTGKMAKAIIASMLQGSALPAAEIIAFDTSHATLDKAAKDFGIAAANSNKEVVEKSEIVFLAVKPQDLSDVFKEISGVASNEKLFVSIAAGVSIEELQRGLPNARIVRVMPNIACLAQATMACFAAAENATEKDKQFVETVFARAGKVLEIAEEKMHAVTALSGSGPGFIAFFMDEMRKAAVQQGLGKEEAELLAKQTLLGTAKLLNEKNISAEELVKMVASPKGTTEAGLDSFEENGFSKAIQDAIAAAVKRSRELGK